MLIYRTATRSFSAASRRYSTQTPASKPANWPLFLSGAGVVGLAAYVYLGYKEKGTLLGSATPIPPKDLKPALDKDNFVAFEVKKIETYNHNTKKYTFALPEGTASLLPIASAILARAADESAVADKDGKPIIRPYTPISDPATPGEIELLIKKYDTGKLTPHIHSLKVGDKFALKGPIPKWPYKINEFDEVGLIGGGSGITPLYQVLTHALRDPANKTKFKLVYANVSPADILLREEFEALKAKHPEHFDYVFVVDKGDAGWKGPTGYITSELLKQHLAPPSVGEKVKVFICGPPGQVSAIAGPKDRMKQGELKGILKELGYNEGQVYKF